MALDTVDKVLAWIEESGQRASAADNAELAVAALVSAYYDELGDRSAHLLPGALKADEKQFFVGGCFVLTPDSQFHMLVGSRGFPAEQQRLMVPATAGNPGQVYASKEKLLLANTDEHEEFRKYLKTARMGSAMYAPMIWQGRYLGQMVMAAQARGTMRTQDLAALSAMAQLATAVWMAKAGPAWLEQAYPPADGFYVDAQGLE